MWETRKQPQVQVSRIHPNHPKWLREVLIFCWGGTGWNCETLHKQKTPRCLAIAKATSPKNPWRSTSPKVRCFFRKNWGFLGIRVIFTPKLWGNDPIFEEHIFQRETWSHQLVLYRFSCGATPGVKKSSLLKSVFKGDQVMAVQQQRQGPNGCGVLVAKNLVLGVM